MTNTQSTQVLFRKKADSVGSSRMTCLHYENSNTIPFIEYYVINKLV